MQEEVKAVLRRAARLGLRELLQHAQQLERRGDSDGREEVRKNRKNWGWKNLGWERLGGETWVEAL